MGVDGWIDGGSSLDLGHAEARQLGSVEKEVLLSSSRAASGQGSRRGAQHLEAGEMDHCPGLPGEAVQQWEFKCV